MYKKIALNMKTSYKVLKNLCQFVIAD